MNVCPTCGDVLVRGKRGPTPTYCSAVCRVRAWRAANREYVSTQAATKHRASYQPVIHDHLCAVCAAPFASRFRIAKYCSAKCRNRAQTQARKDSGQLDTYRSRPDVLARNRATVQAWKEKYPERHRASRRRSDAKRGRATRRLEILERDGWICQLCGKPILRDSNPCDPLSAHVDHVIPRALGGGHDPSNLQAAHRLCNMQKGARLLT